MPEPIVLVDTSEIQKGKLSEVKAAIHELVEFVEANEARPVSYGMYLDPSGTRMTVVQVHPDSASMEFHMKVAAPVFSKFKDLIKLSTMEVYGKPSDSLLDQLRHKAKLLGTATLAVHGLEAGFTRAGVERERISSAREAAVSHRRRTATK